MRRARQGSAIGALVVSLVLAGCSPESSSNTTSQSTESGTCTAGATATVRHGSGPEVPVIREMQMTVPVGQTVSVTYAGPCPKGGRLMISKPGPGSGLRAFTGFSYWTGSPTHTWTPTEPGVRALDVAWACTGPVPCPLGSLGIITITTPTSP